MAKLIEVPGQGVVEFPDNMNDDAIAAAIRANMPAPQERGVMQALDDRARWLANFATFGYADKLAAKGDELMGRGGYDENLARERARSTASEQNVSTPEKIGLGVAGVAPMMLYGGPTALAAKGAQSLGLPVANMLARAATPQTVLGRAALGAVEGAGMGALEATGRDTDVTEGAALGGGIGVALPLALGAAGRAISPVSSNLTREQQRLAQEASNRGIQLSPAQLTGNPTLGYAESMLRDLPGGGMSPRAGQQQAINRQMLATAGVADDLAGPEVIENGFRQLGQTFDGVLQGKTVDFGADLKSDVSKVVAEYYKTLPSNVRQIFTSQARDLLQASPRVDGEFANNVRSQLAKLERSYPNDARLQSALTGLREAVDDAINRSLSGAEATALREARGQYKNLKRIEEAMSRNTVGTEAGNIPAAGVRSAVAMRGATPEMETLSRIARTFVNDPPNSGTAQRQYINSIATGAAGGGAGYMMGGPIGAVAGMVAGPYMANVAYNNPLMRAYLTNQAGRSLERLPPAANRAATMMGLGLLD